MAVDLDISFRILFLLNVLFPNHHVRALTAVFREFERRIREEMDLRQEAANTEQFRRLFADDARVRAPRGARSLHPPAGAGDRVRGRHQGRPPAGALRQRRGSPSPG